MWMKENGEEKWLRPIGDDPWQVPFSFYNEKAPWRWVVLLKCVTKHYATQRYRVSACLRPNNQSVVVYCFA